MLPIDDKIDMDFQDISEILPQLSDNSRIYYDYNGCLPQYDDAADHYKLTRRYSNVTF